ncbi:MAG: 2-amino-4-hydroxy-6-hydroxymethyldihydropteridine diphosphokinase [Chloroflexi bacterium]|nr:2-amino-4-hydroxy-6-hydroxymethyldihydropteridine diphosphokinase [Chloroflexota bacterium]
MARVLLGLGANLGDRAANLYHALSELCRHGARLLALSPLYETEPWGVQDQPRFLNAACQVEVTLEPQALLAMLKEIEKLLGRQPTVRYGPRPIDLDILLYDDVIIDTPQLQIPHPGMLARGTVLVPLADIVPQIRHPLSGRTIAEHLAELGPTPDVAPYPPGLPPK